MLNRIYVFSVFSPGSIQIFHSSIRLLGVLFLSKSKNFRFSIHIKAVVAVSVETLVFIVIGRSCSEGCGFDSHCRPGSFLRFNFRPIMYGAVGSLGIESVFDTTTSVHFLLVPLDSIV